MNTVITSALALVLLASMAESALAQDGGYNPAMRRSSRNNPDNAAAQAQTPSPQRVEDQDARRREEVRRIEEIRRNEDARRSDNDRRRDRDDDNRRGGWQGRDNDRDRDDDRRRDGDRWGDDRRDSWDRNRSGWDRDRSGWERNRPRYDPRNYPRTWRTPQRYRGFVYRPPPGFYARSWAFGEILPHGWYEPQHRILDWWSYGLPIPPIGYDWVRVGDDVLLVDSFSGRIVQVVRNLFW